MGIKILGTGSYLPEKILTNDDLSKMVETNDEWISSRTGIHSRHIAPQGCDTVTMGTEAAKKALEMAGVSPEEVNLVLVSSCTGDETVPIAACRIQNEIGASNAAAIEMNVACAGFVGAMITAEAFLKAGNFSTILIVSTETMSHITNWEDRGTCILFGDGAGAVLVKNDPAPEYAAGMLSTLRADASKCDAIQCRKDGVLSMDGHAVYRFATTTVPKCLKETLEKGNLKAEDVRYYLLHQANSRIIDSIARRLSLDISRFPMNIAETGNTSSASIAILLDQCSRSGLLQRGDKIAFSGFGGGLTYGAAILTW